MIGHIDLPNGVTWCPETPENTAHFERLKASINAGHGGQKRTLGQQIARENKRLRKLSCYLPGHEPDR